MTAGGPARRCSCGTRLAKDNPGTQCGACAHANRTRAERPPAVPPQFWHDEALRAALAHHDMGAVMHAYRTHPHHGRVIPQEIAARWVGSTQTRLSRIENGQPINNIIKLTHWARVLAIPPDLLWFPMPGTTTRPGRVSQHQEATCGQAGRTPGERDEVNRRQLLRLLSTASAALTLDIDRLTHATTGQLGTATLDEYAALNAHLWQVFTLSPTKTAMLPLARHQVEVLTTALHQTSNSAVRGRLCVLLADLAQLAGEVLFDANAYTDAAHCYTLTAAGQAGAQDLWACALTRHAYIALYDQDSGRALPMLDLAAHLAGRGDHGLPTRHWIATVQAHALADQGQLDACQHALDLAQTVHDLPAPAGTHGWLRFDGSRLPEERGACYTQLGRADLASTVLTEALPHITSTRRRGAVLADLAITGAHHHDLDQVLTHGTAAAHLAHQSGSGYLAHKLAALRPHLAPVSADPRVRELCDLLPATVGTSA